MKVERMPNTTSSNYSFLVTIEPLMEQAISECLEQAIREMAKYYVDANMDKITAKLDLSGMANLIAVYASKKLADDIKK